MIPNVTILGNAAARQQALGKSSLEKEAATLGRNGEGRLKRYV
jgi:hypothetical protein